MKGFILLEEIAMRKEIEKEPGGWESILLNASLTLSEGGGKEGVVRTVCPNTAVLQGQSPARLPLVSLPCS